MDSAVWGGEAALEAVMELNAMVLAKLTERAESVGNGMPLPPIVGSMLELWRGLDGHALERAARMPVLLVSARFEDDELWSQVENGGGPAASSAESDWLAIAEARVLLTQILQAAANVGDAYAVRALFGMALGLANRVNGLSRHQIDALATRHAGVLRPRWEDCPVLWRDLLVAARGARERDLSRVHLYAIRLLDETLMRRRIMRTE